MKALVASDGLGATAQPILREAEVLGSRNGVFSAFFSLESSAAAPVSLDLHDLARGDAPEPKAATAPLTAIDAKPQLPAPQAAPRPADMGEQSLATASRFAALVDDHDSAAKAFADWPEGMATTAPQKPAYPEVEPAGSDATMGAALPAPLLAPMAAPTFTPARSRADGEAAQALNAVGPSHTGQTALPDPLAAQNAAPVAVSRPEAFAGAAARDARADAPRPLPAPQNGEAANASAAMPPQSALAAVAIGAAIDTPPDVLPAPVAIPYRGAAAAAARPHADPASDVTRRIPETYAPAPQTAAHLPTPPSMQAAPPAPSDGAISALQNSVASGVEVRAIVNTSAAPTAAAPDVLHTAQGSRLNTARHGWYRAAGVAPPTGLLAAHPGHVSPARAPARPPLLPFAAQQSVSSVSSTAEAEPKTPGRAAIRGADAPPEASIRSPAVAAAAVPPATAVAVVAAAPTQQPDSVAAIDPARPVLSNSAAPNQAPDNRAQAISSGASAASQAPQPTREALFSLDDAGTLDPMPQTDAAQPSFSRNAYDRAPVGGAQMAALQTAEHGAAVVRQIADSVARGTDRTVELTLAPEELGRVRLTVATTEQGVTVSVQADRPDTLDLIRRNIDQLARDFRDLGYSAINFHFGEKPQDRGQSAPQGPLVEPSGDDPHNQPRPAPRAGAARSVVSGGLDLRL